MLPGFAVRAAYLRGGRRCKAALEAIGAAALSAGLGLVFGWIGRRREDIPLLVNYFVAKASREMGKQIKTISSNAMQALTNYPWKGNVRELANYVERAVILSRGEELEIRTRELIAPSPQTTPISAFHQAERDVIVDALKAAAGRIAGRSGAAERLGLKRTTLQNKMRKLGIARKSL